MIIELGSDRSLRQRYFTEASFAHPAKLHLGLLAWLVERYTLPGQHIVDPMGGIGSTLYAALLQRDVTIFDVEPAWLAEAHQNAARIHAAAGLFAGRMTVAQRDARQPWGLSADVALFSPPYACDVARNSSGHGMDPEAVRRRLAKVSHNSKIWERALSGAAVGAQGALLMHYGKHPDQVGHFRGARYWEAMTAIYQRAHEALQPGGLMLLVIKDHIVKGRRVCVATETAERCAALGFTLVERHARKLTTFSLWQRRRREKGMPVIEEEDVIVLRKSGE